MLLDINPELWVHNFPKENAHTNIKGFTWQVGNKKLGLRESSKVKSITPEVNVTLYLEIHYFFLLWVNATASLGLFSLFLTREQIYSLVYRVHSKLLDIGPRQVLEMFLLSLLGPSWCAAPAKQLFPSFWKWDQTCFQSNSQELSLHEESNASSTLRGSKGTWSCCDRGPEDGWPLDEWAGRKNHTHLLSSAMSSAVQGTPSVIREMLLMAGLTNARHVVTADRTQTTALNLPLHRWKQIKSISKGSLVCGLWTSCRHCWWEWKLKRNCALNTQSLKPLTLTGPIIPLLRICL